MRTLIVGCGYVGLPLGAELARRGHEVFGLRRNIEAAAEMRQAGIQPLFGDISKAVDLKNLPEPFDWVVNCAASGGGTVEDYRRLYLEGTRNLIEWLKPSPPRRFVYTSSTSVYGQDDGLLVTEDSLAEPLVETARVLVETELLLLTASRQGSLPALVLRLAGIYGPERGYWLRQFLNDSARLEGDGSRYLNMVHRDDVVGCILEALESGQSGEIYNVVDDEPVRQLELFRWLAVRLGRGVPSTQEAETELVRRRGATSKYVSNRKLKADFSYHFKYPTFREGFEFELRELSRGAC